MNSVPILSSSQSIHFCYTISRPLNSLRNSKKIFDLLELSFFSSEQTISKRIIKRARLIIDCIKTIDATPGFALVVNKIFLTILPGKIDACVADIRNLISKQPLDLETAQQIYELANELNRHHAHRIELWNGIAKSNRIVLSHFTKLTENLNVLHEPIFFQWLGDGKLERANQFETSVIDCGDGYLFKVECCSDVNNQHYSFPLVNHRGCILIKRCSEFSKFSRFSLSEFIQKAGRFCEIFNIRELEIESENSNIKDECSDLFSWYRLAIYSVLNMPISLPLAVGEKGEWSIWSDQSFQISKNVNFSPAIVADLHHYFQIEKLWRIKIFHRTTFIQNVDWMILGEHVVLKEILPLPTFFNQEMEKRHDSFYQQLKLDSNAEKYWNDCEEMTRVKQEEIFKCIKGLRFLIDHGRISLEHLVNFDSQTLLISKIMHIMRAQSLMNVDLLNVLDIVVQIFKNFIPEQPEIPYTYQQTLEQNGFKLTESLLQKKIEFRDILLSMVIFNYVERKNTIDELKNSLIEEAKKICEKIADHLDQISNLQWPFSEKISDHFMMLLGHDFLTDFQGVISKELDDSDQLFLHLLHLRAAADFLDSDSDDLNRRLQSLLHDAMIKKYSKEFLKYMNEHVFKALKLTNR